MSKAHVEPAELRKFARDLSKFNAELEMLLGGLHGKVRSLETTWRDQEQKKFSDAFNSTVKMVGQFLEASHEHVSTLNKKAQLIEDYLKQR